MVSNRANAGDHHESMPRDGVPASRRPIVINFDDPDVRRFIEIMAEIHLRLALLTRQQSSENDAA